MENEAAMEPSDSQEQNIGHEKVKEQSKSTRSSQKTILAAVIVSVVTIGALSIVRDQIDSPRKDATVVAPSVAALDITTANGTGADIDGVFEMIERSIESLSERTSQWFESLRAEHSRVNHELSGLANSMSAIQESITELHKGNEELKQRIGAAQSLLQVIARDVKATAKKKGLKQAKHALAKPPFHIDAIDLWDDAVYVAVSQGRRVAFLREGEQRSDWTVTHIDRIKEQVAFRGPAGQDYTTSLRR